MTHALAINYIVNCFMSCTLILVLGMKMDRNVLSFHEVHIFRALTANGAVVSLSELLWMAFSRSEALATSQAAQWCLDMASLGATSITTYFWYCFINERLLRNYGRKEYRARKYIALFPLVVTLGMHLLSPWYHLTFWVTSNGEYVRGPLYLTHVVLTMGYLFVAVGLCLVRCRSYKSTERQELTQLAVFTCFPILGGILQVVIGEAPFSAMSMTAAVLYLFINLQERRIGTDALTGLTNRARMHEVLAYKVKNAAVIPFYLMMADIDSFKKINDKYGHLEGDEALICVADAFRCLGKRYRSLFICRYGGDEFLFTVNKDEEKSPEKIEQALQMELDEICREKKLAYALRMSVGCCEANRADTPVPELLLDADQQLYQKKAK